MKTFSEIRSFIQALFGCLLITLIWYWLSLMVESFIEFILLKALGIRTVVVPYLFFVVCFLAPAFFVWKKIYDSDWKELRKELKELWKKDIEGFFMIYISYIFMCVLFTESFIVFVKKMLEIPSAKMDSGYWLLWSILSFSPLIWIFNHFTQVAGDGKQTNKETAGNDEKTNRKESAQSSPLGESEEAEIKRLYRYACQKCHPDKMPPELKKEGEELFKQLNDAYRRGDLARVKEIALKLVGL